MQLETDKVTIEEGEKIKEKYLESINNKST